MFKKEVVTLLEKEVKPEKGEIINLIEIPPPDLGDYSFPCFTLAKKFRKNPIEIAKDLAVKIKPTKIIERIEAAKGYVNFFIKKNVLAERVLGGILKGKEKFGYSIIGKGKKVVIESPGPNTNKPLHLGHLRNMAIGISLSNLFKATGHKVINVDIVNDRGIHIAKSMLAYKKFGKNKQPTKKQKPDHFVGDFYVLYNKKEKQNPELKEELNEMLRKYEEKDKETIALLKKMNSWAIKGIKETYKRFGMHVDKVYFETEHYEKGKAIVLKYLKKGIFKKDKDGSVFINLEAEKLGKKILLRADGTSLYITQDLYLAIKRYQDYRMNKMIYVVGSEQIYHFKVLFTLLKMVRFKFTNSYYHLPYGMVYLPEGKMKSREGSVVDADDLLDEIAALAKKEISRREPKLNKKELEERAEHISLAATKFFILKHDALKDFTYKPEEAISFEGETGPYIQYAHARASSILRKAQEKPKFSKRVLRLKEKEEHLLVRELSKFPELVEKATERLKPDVIANYAYTLAKTFTNFYSSLKVLTEDKQERQERLILTAATKQVLTNALNLLSIKALERM